MSTRRPLSIAVLSLLMASLMPSVAGAVSTVDPNGFPLRLSIVNNQQETVAGGTATYTLTVKNTGTTVQQAPYVTTSLTPSNANYVWTFRPDLSSPGCSSQTSNNKTTITCDGTSPIAPGQTATFTVGFMVPPTVICPVYITLDAEAGRAAGHQVVAYARNMDTLVACGPSAQSYPFRLSIAANQNEVIAGETASYTFSVKNIGTAVEVPYIVPILAPANATFPWNFRADLSTPGCASTIDTQTPGGRRWTSCIAPSPIAPGETATFTVAFTVPPAVQCPVYITMDGQAGRASTGGFLAYARNMDTLVGCPSTVTPPPVPQCRDGIDNDGDGATDFPADFSCSSSDDNDETNPKSQCQDGIDNDNDGLVDYPQDAGCSSKQDNDESNVMTPALPACSDGIDNDGDGKTDFFDAGCYPNNIFNPVAYNPNDADEGNAAQLCRWTRVNSQWVRTCQ